MSVLTLTVNPALDKSSSIPNVLPDNKLYCKNIKYDPGGGGINVARVIQRLGGKVKAAFQSSGSSGKLLEELLQKEQIDFVNFDTNAWTRENFIVVDESTQKQYRFGMTGPTYLRHEWEACLDLIKGTDPLPEFLVLSGSLAPGIPDDFYARICHWAKEKEIKLVLDTAGTPLKKAIEVGAYLVKPNLGELSAFAGKNQISQAEQEEIALQLIAAYDIEMVVVSLGSRGAMMASADGIKYVTPPTIIAKSTVGAGDSMVAGMVWALTQGHEELDVIRYGVACGTAATMNVGTGLCRNEDVDEIFNWLRKNKH
jgi:6-phosphofructokinase 2